MILKIFKIYIFHVVWLNVQFDNNVGYKRIGFIKQLGQ